MQRFCWLLSCLITLQVSAQEKLMIRGKPADLYVVYTTGGSENLQDVSNQFGLAVTKISVYNKININTATRLPGGTEIRIPVNRDILLQHPAESAGPVYYAVQKGDDLFKIGQLCFKVPVSKIRTWNHLKNDKITGGMHLIIGYLVNAKPISKTQDITKKELPVISQDGNQALSKPEEKNSAKQVPVPPVQPQKTGQLVLPQKIATGQDKEIEKKDHQKTEKTAERKWYSPAPYIPKEGDEGYFAAGYAEEMKDKSLNEMTGDAATFKSVSGWTDRKFYVLMNDVKPKTLVRITSANHKSICAMVLGPLQETKGAVGLLLRMSNSAASSLGIPDERFKVTLTFFE